MYAKKKKQQIRLKNMFALIVPYLRLNLLILFKIITRPTHNHMINLIILSQSSYSANTSQNSHI